METRTQPELREWRLILELEDITVRDNQVSEVNKIAAGKTADSDKAMENWTPEQLGLSILDHLISDSYCPSDLSEYNPLMICLRVKSSPSSYWQFVTNFYPKKFTCNKCGGEYYVLVSSNQDYDANFVPPSAMSGSPLVSGECKCEAES